MDPWVWLGAYLVGFTLLQLLLYRRFGRNVARGDATPGGQETGASAASTGGDQPTDDAVVCPHCGTTNEPEPTFSFCRACCESLD